MRIFISIILFLSFSSVVFADQPIVGVVGVGYEEVEDNQIKYDSELIKGEPKYWILNTPVYDLIHYNGQKYERLDGKADYVSVSPNTKVTFGYWFLNNTLEEIQIYSADFFHSRTNLEFGDLTRLGSNGQYTSYGRKSSFVSINKTYQPSTNPLGEILFEFTTIQPIKINSYSSKVRLNSGKKYLDYTLEIENTSEYELCNIEIENILPSTKVFSETVCLQSKGKKEFKYSDDITEIKGNVIVTDGVIVKDPNHHSETITTKLSNIDDENTEGSAMIFNSNLGSALSLGEMENELTVELIPYWMQAENITNNIPVEQKSIITTPTNSVQPKYSFTIINEIKKDKEKSVIDAPVKNDVLGIADTSTQIEKKNYLIWYAVGAIFLIICVWFLGRLW